MKNMIELYDLSKLINLISIKNKIINKICYFYIKYLEQIDLNAMEKNLVHPTDLVKSFLYINTFNKMTNDLDKINIKSVKNVK